MPAIIDHTGATIRNEAIPAPFAHPAATKRDAMFRAVFRELANRRAGTASTLRRDEVRGGGKKPWRQKGTGRARHGSIRSPQWRKGGVVFGPKPRSFAVSLNKKERRAAFVSALADRFQNDCISVLATEGFALQKTSDLANLLFGSPKAAKSGQPTLIVYARDEAAAVGRGLERIARNLSRVAVTNLGALDVKDVLGYPRFILTTGAYEALLKAFAAQPGDSSGAGAPGAKRPERRGAAPSAPQGGTP